jgi:signal transduction histidine kinase/ligand-binding sensor domain-containing protein
MKSALALITISILTLLLGCPLALGLDPSLDVSQYAHTVWTVRDGFSLGNVYAMAQTPDGYLWLGSEFGLFRFDGIHAVPWQPPAGQQLPDKNINALLVTRDGSLWIGTFAGLVTLSGGKLSRPPAIPDHFVASLFEDSHGTVWVGSLERSGRLCAIRNGSAQCYGEDGAFGRAVWALYEDSSGTLWAAAESGLWRVEPGPPRRYLTRRELIGLDKTDDGRLLIAVHAAGLMQLVGDKVEPYPLRPTINSDRIFKDHDVDSNRLLRDRDGGLWIGTVERGLIHVHQGRTDIFTRVDGLSGDVILSIFEDREGNVWVASTGGLDRFRELPVATVSVKQGLSSDATQSVLAAPDGSVWIGSHEGLTRWKGGQTTVFGKASGLPDDVLESLFLDKSGRIWVSTRQGLAYFKDGRFLAVNSVPGAEVHYISGDEAGNVWLAEHQRLLHLQEGRLVEQFPWSELGRSQTAAVLLSDPNQGGVWLGFWVGGGVWYFNNRQVHSSYTAADGLGEGGVTGLQLDRDGALWAATELGGLSRIKDGHIATLTDRNGLPCNAIHWSLEDDDRAFWLYTSCGLVRIAHTELDEWIADPKRRIETTVWDAADGVRLRSSAASAYGPRVTKSSDGKLWFVTGEGVQVVDPRHLAVNKLPPSVRIEEIVADHKIYWRNITGAGAANLHLPPRVRDLEIDYTALSLVAPEKVHFKYKLEGQDQDWREVVNDRDVQYSNLAPRHYQFRVMASNNSGVWNEQGDTLEFSVDPAYSQTNLFRALCAAFFIALLWAAYQLRVRQLHHEFTMTLDARVGERTRIARDLHDTLLQSFHGLLLRFQTVSQLLPERPIEAKEKLDSAIEQAAGAITEGRDAVQGIRTSTVERNDLALAISTLGEELENDTNNHRPPTFRVAVEGQARNLHPILRDEIYKIAAEALRNAFHHAQAMQVEVEIRYDDDQFQLRVRDDGKGMDAAVFSSHSLEGHYGLRGMRERATLIQGKLVVWSEVDAGTEVELRVPASAVYTTDRKPSWWLRKFAPKA